MTKYEQEDAKSFAVNAIKITSIIVSIMVILSTLYYVIADRFETKEAIISNRTLIDKNRTKFEGNYFDVTERVKVLEDAAKEVKKDNNDIKFNLKRFMEKNGVKWWNFDDDGVRGMQE